MENPLMPEWEEAALGDALETYPLAEMPRGITAEVLRRIQTVPAPRSFRPAWTDLVLSAALAICIGAIWYSLQNLPPLAVAQLRKESILLYQQVLLNARWLLPALSFGLAAFFAALAIPYLRRELMK